MLYSPSFALSFLIATLVGAVGHLITGGPVRKLILFILASWVGFAIGQAFGEIMDIQAMRIGAVNVMAGTLGSVTGVITAAILALRRDRVGDFEG